jgi:hypothetical protein
MRYSKGRFNFYQSILRCDIRGFDNVVDWFEQRTDSQLETMFGLSYLSVLRDYREFFWVGDGWFHDNSFDVPYYIEGNYLRIPCPNAYSPSCNGVDCAMLTTQQYHNGMKWDFGIFLACHNSTPFKEARLSTVIDVDGYNIHRQRRSVDRRKTDSATVKSVRILEERFTCIEQAALAALFKSVWCAPQDCQPQEMIGYRDLMRRLE